MATSYADSLKEMLAEQEQRTTMSLRSASVLATETETSWTLCDDGRYEYTDNYADGMRYEDENLSYVDEMKNVTINQNQVNVSQESLSQYIPFEMFRYYDGIDLMNMILSVYYVNRGKKYNEDKVVNVRYSDSKIRFGWVVSKEATLVSGELKIEIHAKGNNPFGNEYLLKTVPNNEINIIESLAGDGKIVIVEEEWATTVVEQVQQYAEDAQSAASSANSAAAQAKAVLTDINNKSAEMETNITNSVTANITANLEGIVDNKMDDYSTKEETSALIGDTGFDEEGNTKSVVAYVDDAIKGADISDKLADYATLEYVGNVGTDEEGNELTVKQYIDNSIANINVSDEIDPLKESIETINTDLAGIHTAIDDLPTTLAEDYYTKEQTYSKDEVDGLIKGIDVKDQLVDYAKKSDLDGYATSTDLTNVNNNTVTNAENIAIAQNDIASIQATLNALEGDNQDLIIQYDEVGSVLHLYEKDETGDITITDGDVQVQVKEIYSTIITGGGGSGSGSVATIKINLRQDGESSSTVLYGSEISLNYTLSTRKAVETQDEEGNDITVYEEAVIPGDITMTLYRDNVYLADFTVTKASAEVQSESFDISEYVTLGNQVFTIKAVYMEQLGDGNSIAVRSSADWAINAVNLKITNLPDSTWETTPKYSATTFSYTPIGALEKTVYFQIDDNEPTTVVTSLNGTALTHTIPMQTHGVHSFKIWCEGNVGGTIISTEPTEYLLMFVESGNNTPIIRIKAPTTLEQYSSANIYWNVLDPLNSIIDYVSIYDEDGVVLSSVEGITSAEQRLEFRPSVVKDKTITVQYKEITESVVIEVTKFPYEINAVTDGLVLDFVPTGRTNSDTDYNVFKNNAYTTEIDSETGEEIHQEIPMTWTFSDNFDWINGGWKTDENGDTYFCVKSGTSVDINYNLFGTDGVVAQKDANGQYIVAGTGKEFKLIFKTTNVAQANTTWLSCIDVADKASLGLRMEAQNGYIDSSLGTLEIPYVDDDIIEFDMNIVPITKFTDTGEPSFADETIPMIITYEDGTPVQPKVITSAYTNFKQDTPQPISIGSEHCDVHIYRMKIYERYLKDKEILTNFIADARTGTEMAKRFVENDIYPVEDKQKITPESVAAACPDLKVYVLSAPYFTNDKGNKVPETTIRQIHNTGTREKPVYDPSENWTATNATHNGQGTSSNEYGYSGRNLEFNMKKATITLNDNTTVVSEIQLSPTSYPTNYLNFKTNIASSEHANNALLQKRYDRYLPYTTIASLLDGRKKNSMEFFNCVVFIQETNEDISTHREFSDTSVHFYGIGNIGDSKRTDDSRVNDENDQNEYCVEVMDWNRDLSSFPMETRLLAEHTINYAEAGDSDITVDNLSNLYEKVSTEDGDSYILVSDAAIVDGKTYYIKSEIIKYSELLIPENCGENGIIYEMNSDGELVHSTDTEIDLTKDYYVDILEGDDFSEDYTYGFRYVQSDCEDNEELLAPLRKSWIDFYRFITRDLTTNGVEDSAKVAAWKAEFSDWFVLESALYYYLYTLRYTMVDSRAKNSFYHWGKYYITANEAIEKGIALYDADKNLIEENYDSYSTFYDVNGKEIKNINNAAALINDGYRMEYWAYDFDFKNMWSK